MFIRYRTFAHPGIPPYTGFVYLWRDRSNGKFYLGSHEGPIDDYYKGSGNHFKNAYRLRKEFFRRRILEYVCGSKLDLKIREEYWLSKIDDAELCGKKYYNRTKNARGSVIKDEAVKFNLRTIRIGTTLSDAHKRAIGDAARKQKTRLGTTQSPETRQKIADKITGIKRSVETRQLIAAANTGLKHGAERVAKMQAVKKAAALKWFTNGVSASLYKLGDEPDGWVLGRKIKK